MKYLSLFSGVGGFEKGIIDSGVSAECVGYSEIDRYAIQIYKKHFPNHLNLYDITTIIPNELPDFDLLVGGFPCQAFSIAGKRGGFNDTRGTLFFDIARILADKKPRDLLLENVKGLLSHDGGKTFQTIIGVLTDLGYFVEWQVLNSKNFGVPQNRERVFIRGHLGGEPRRKVFPIGESDGVYNKQGNEGIGKCLTATNYKGIGNDGTTLVADYRYDDGLRIRKNNICPTLRARGREKDISGSPLILRGRPRYQDGKRELKWYEYKETCPAATTNVAQGDQKNMVCKPVLTPDRPIKRQNGRRMKDNGEPSFTLTSQDKHGVYDGMKIRRLTPTECERLQGFPDGWTEGLSDTQRYKTLGNAVTTNVIKEIIKRIYQ